GDRDVRVVAGDVLPQERWIHPERDGGAVLDDALSDLRQDAVSAVAGIELGACESAREQRDDDEDDQNDRLAVETGRGALLAGQRRWRGGRGSAALFGS